MNLLRHLGVSAALLFATAVSASAAEIRLEGYPDFDSKLERLLPDFQEETGLKVHVLMNNWEEHHRRLATTLATGRGAADIVYVDVGKVGAFVNGGGFVDLTERYKDIAGHYAQYAVAQGRGPDGKQYAVPVDIGPGVMYYRRDFMEDAGYALDDVVDSWEAYVEYGRWLQEEHGVLLIGDATSVAQAIVFTEVEPGNGFYFDRDGQPILTSERFVRAFSIAKQIRDEGLDGRINDWTEDWYEGFREGRFATELSGAWLLGHMQNWIAPETSGQWGVSGLPAGVYGSWGGSFLAIPTHSQNVDQAWQLISHLLEAETQKAAFRNIAAFPAHVGTYDDPMFDEEIEFLRGQRARQLFAEIAQNVEPVTPHAGDNIAYDMIFEVALPRVLNDGEAVEKALADAERQLRRRLRTL
ncbi:sugar ABC transporter substrate-binding protein [Alkalilimnicola ehrlichii]|uniref:Sugar ABC transporter substrate-binding protein n=1 Tax=Alkalilimnicola ehrlichii TaxID=351052 RepID=A0A3E0WSE0_9GAMM|nr:extracellular solute-binding protein [Alkalilimnicola ehrlichii]RFA28604.1 sugar ABC transporter substrate-binding protein [Alkalilimnicola ehrlichii]RFA35768.1 sugar ABC transporter substrate-binding protein [Alkalilimnicola ehrlichii]